MATIEAGKNGHFKCRTMDMIRAAKGRSTLNSGTIFKEKNLNIQNLHTTLCSVHTTFNGVIV